MVEDRVIFHGFAGGADGFFAPACASRKMTIQAVRLILYARKTVPVEPVDQ